MTRITEEIQELFNRVRSLLGAPIRSVELTDKQLCDLLQVAIEDYGERVLNEVIRNNWMGFYGKNIANSKELALDNFDIKKCVYRSALRFVPGARLQSIVSATGTNIVTSGEFKAEN